MSVKFNTAQNKISFNGKSFQIWGNVWITLKNLSEDNDRKFSDIGE